MESLREAAGPNMDIMIDAQMQQVIVRLNDTFTYVYPDVVQKSWREKKDGRIMCDVTRKILIENENMKRLTKEISNDLNEMKTILQ